MVFDVVTVQFITFHLDFFLVPLRNAQLFPSSSYCIYAAFKLSCILLNDITYLNTYAIFSCHEMFHPHIFIAACMQFIWILNFFAARLMVYFLVLFLILQCIIFHRGMKCFLAQGKYVKSELWHPYEREKYVATTIYIS
jgi:hypothetical protein